MRSALLALCLLSSACSGDPAAPNPAQPADDSSHASLDAAEPIDAAGPSPDASGIDASLLPDGSSPAAFIAGVNVHDYPKPNAYGFTQADGADRMGAALEAMGVTHVRGVAIGDVPFLARLQGFGVTHVVLLLDPKACGKPFSADTLKSLLDASVTEAQRLGLTVQVEGLNEWDLFNSKSYNAGVTPAGMTPRDFVGLTQKALYEAAHPLGLTVLGPSVGHPHEDAAYAGFPDVSSYVDVVNMHFYYGTDPANLPIPERVAKHQAFQGTGKPVWVTETGVSQYGDVSAEKQAQIISTGLHAFAQSGMIQAAFNYELLDNQKPGWSGVSFIPDNAEYHFGLFTYEGAAKPAADVIKQFILAP